MTNSLKTKDRQNFMKCYITAAQFPHELHATDIIRTPGFHELGAGFLRYAQIGRQ